MPVVSSVKDAEALTMTFVAEFDAGVDRVWQVWQDPRLLERWWGPPNWPATFGRYEFAAGGRVAYYMTGPDGEKFHGLWTITAIDAPHRLEFEDGFADENGQLNEAMGTTRAVMTLEATGTGTRMTTTTTFESADQLEQMATMGMEEGMRLAQDQIDGLLKEDPR